MASEVNMKARLDSVRGLTIFFIIAIFLINAFLVVRIVRKNRFMYRPKWLTLLSLVIGDIILVLFPLVVQAKLVFASGVKCQTMQLAHVYEFFLLTFVYGVGLVVLVVEMVVRHRSGPRPPNGNIAVSLAYSAVPWALGLVVVLPLTLSDGICPSDSSVKMKRAWFGVCFCLPASAAVVTSIICKMMTLTPVHEYNQFDMALSPSPPPALLEATAPSTETPSGHFPTSEQVQTHQWQNSNTSNAPQPYYNGPQYPAPLQYGAPQGPPQYGSPQGSPQYCAPQGPSQFGVPQGPPQYSTPQDPPHYISPQCPPQYAYPMVTSPTFVQPQCTTRREQEALLWISIAYFICVIPYAAFILSTVLETPQDLSLSPVVFVTLSDGFTWLTLLRSVITPLLWWGFIKDEA